MSSKGFKDAIATCKRSEKGGYLKGFGFGNDFGYGQQAEECAPSAFFMGRAGNQR